MEEKNISNPIIFISGLPRSGSTWLAYIINSAPEVKHYFHEPFNPRFVPGSQCFYRKYKTANDEAKENKDFCDSIFSGEPFKSQNPVLFSKNKRDGIKKDDLLLVKDVHASMMLEWFEANYESRMMTIIRNPLNLAASWFDVWVKPMPPEKQKVLLCKPIENILEQEQLVNKYLKKQEKLIREANDFWEHISVFWGMVYTIELAQAKARENTQENTNKRLVVTHESLCKNPEDEFKKLFLELNLTWGEESEKILEKTTKNHSQNPYKPLRHTEKEVDKWKSCLEDQQIKKIKKFAEPFEIDLYKDFLGKI